MRRRNTRSHPSARSGQITETVSVEAGAELVQTTSAQVTRHRGEAADRRPADSGPQSDWLFWACKPGVDMSGPGSFLDTTINGQRSVAFDHDSGWHQYSGQLHPRQCTGLQPNLPFSSQAQEFTVINQNADVDKGGGASQVSIVTPKGTNHFHGEGFWYYRSNAWAANDWFNDASGVPNTKPAAKPGRRQYRRADRQE